MRPHGQTQVRTPGLGLWCSVLLGIGCSRLVDVDVDRGHSNSVIGHRPTLHASASPATWDDFPTANSDPADAAISSGWSLYGYQGRVKGRIACPTEGAGGDAPRNGSCVDDDADGFYAACDDGPETSAPDCDDGDPNDFPGNDEVCDGLDNDCDPDTAFPDECTDADGDGFVACRDGDDLDRTVFPGAYELCDGKDNDGDGSADFPDETIDADLDLSPACADCDDEDAAVGPCARNVIVFHCDGCGYSQILATRIFLNGNTAPLAFERFPAHAQVTTTPASSAVTDSAAAATAMATGRKVHVGVISMEIPGDGSPLPTVLELHKKQGRSTGLVTICTAAIDASPAAYGAHAPYRANYGTLATSLLSRESGSRPNVIMGQPLDTYLNADTAEREGYTVVSDASSLLALDAFHTQFVAGLFADDTSPTLPERARVALDVVGGNPNGFFLFVETEGTDEAGHANNLAEVIVKLREFVDTVQTVMTWAEGRPHTLIVVLSDHETGGLVIDGSQPAAGVVPVHAYTTTAHTSTNVPLYALGPGADYVSGALDNTAIFALLKGTASM